MTTSSVQRVYAPTAVEFAPGHEATFAGGASNFAPGHQIAPEKKREHPPSSPR